MNTLQTGYDLKALRYAAGLRGPSQLTVDAVAMQNLQGRNFEYGAALANQQKNRQAETNLFALSRQP